MITGVNLATVPFLGSTDASRLQMSAKQLNQCITHLLCKRPFVIGKNWKYLSESCNGFRYTAKQNGIILYTNDEFMVIVYDNKILKLLECPKIKHTSHNFATTIRYKAKEGQFKKNKILFEYDCFFEDVPSYGFNTNVAFMPFFGFNTQDAIVISESFAKQARSIKTQTIEIPIFETSLFQPIYKDSRYQFIPEIGQRINGHILASESVLKGTKTNKKQILSSLNLLELASVFEDNFRFSCVPVISKLENSKISKIKIHHINPALKLIDKNLEKNIETLRTDYIIDIKKIATDLTTKLTKNLSKKILSQYYLMNQKQAYPKSNKLVWVIEIKLTKETPTKIGDKLSNRYANKGVVSLIIPDEFRPVNIKTGEPIDVIMSPLSVFSRMNLGQILEGLISKVMQGIEKNILNTSMDVPEALVEISKLAKILNDNEYAQEIEALAFRIADSEKLNSKFIRSVKNGGLYFEVENFTNINIKKLQSKIKEIYNVQTNDSISLPKSLLNYLKSKLNISLPLPEKNLVFDNIFNTPLYMVKLMHLAESKLMYRDFGQYKSSNKQPVSDKYGNKRGSKLGGMEFDGLLAHDAIQTIKEFRTVKSDAVKLKPRMIEQYITNGKYVLPDTKIQSHTKMVIESLISFLKQ